MARKKKPVVRRGKGPTRRKPHVKKKHSRRQSNARKKRVVRNVVRKPSRTKPKSNRRPKTPRRKHATRKRGKTRKHAKRAESLLKKPRKGGGGGGGGGGDFSPPDRGTRPRDRVEEFHGPIGNTYDAAFIDIDWGDIDWEEFIDEYDDELLDSYSED